MCPRFALPLFLPALAHLNARITEAAGCRFPLQPTWRSCARFSPDGWRWVARTPCLGLLAAVYPSMASFAVPTGGPVQVPHLQLWRLPPRGLCAHQPAHHCPCNPSFVKGCRQPGRAAVTARWFVQTCICACGPSGAVLHYGHAGAPNDCVIKVREPRSHAVCAPPTAAEPLAALRAGWHDCVAGHGRGIPLLLLRHYLQLVRQGVHCIARVRPPADHAPAGSLAVL